MTVASVDYVTRRIFLDASTVNTDWDTLDVYREVRALRRTNEAHRKYKPIIIAGGMIQKTATTYTAPYVQLLYGCRIVPYNASHKGRLIRDTFTDDNLSGRDCFDRTSLSPTVEVDIDVQVDKVEVRTVATSGNVYTLTEISDATWANLTAQLLMTKQELVTKILRNKTVTDPVTGEQVIYDDDGITVLLRGDLYEGTGTGQKYRGQGAERRERLE